jgi:hypothetical protein
MYYVKTLSQPAAATNSLFQLEAIRDFFSGITHTLV